MEFLHLSDIHFADTSYQANRVRNRLIKQLKGDGRSYDFIVVTGDLYYKAQMDNGCHTFLKRLQEECGKPSCQLYLVPGNHDLHREVSNRANLVRAVRQSEELMSNATAEHLCRLGFDDTRRCFEEITGREFKHFVVYQGETNDMNYRIIIINSCLTCLDEHDEGSLRVMSPLVDELEDKIEADGCLNILAMHHGLNYFHKDERRVLQDWVSANSVDLVLCGHTHAPEIATYDYTLYGVKQMTCGTTQNVQYAHPSFLHYRCVDGHTIECTLFSFRDGKWNQDRESLPAFGNGRFEIDIRRLREKSCGKAVEKTTMYDPQLSEIVTFNEQLLRDMDRRFKEAFGDRIRSSKVNSEIKFSSAKIVQSLVNAGIPFDVSLSVANRSVDAMVNEAGLGNTGVSTGVLCKYVYDAICKTPIKRSSDTSSEIADWAGRYSRKYFHGESPISVVDGKKIHQLNHAYIENTFLESLLTTATGYDIYRERIYAADRKEMVNELFDFFRKLETEKVHFASALEICVDIISNEPHPWVCDDNSRHDKVMYNRDKLRSHLDRLQCGNATNVTYIEITYHAAAALVFMVSNLAGCKDTAPLEYLIKMQEAWNSNSEDEFIRKQGGTLHAIVESSGIDGNRLLDLAKSVKKSRVVYTGMRSIDGPEKIRELGNEALRVTDWFLRRNHHFSYLAT